MSRDILPLRLGADTLWSRHSAQLFERALSIREWSCSGRVAYFVPACEAQERFLFPVVPYPCLAPFVSETSSLTVIHFMSGNAWSYRRLVAYGFLGLSRCEVIGNVELAREGSVNRGLRYFQLHIST